MGWGWGWGWGWIGVGVGVGRDGGGVAAARVLITNEKLYIFIKITRNCVVR